MPALDSTGGGKVGALVQDSPAVFVGDCLLCPTCVKAFYLPDTYFYSTLRSDHRIFRHTKQAHCMSCGAPVTARAI